MPTLGIIMLDTTFDRPLGDAGNPASWPFPVDIERVRGAYAKPVVTGEFSALAPFIAAAQRLVARGACAVTSTCGFLVRHECALAEAVPVPVALSALTKYADLALACAIKHQRVGILTINANALNAATRVAAAIPPDALVFSLSDDAHFVNAILNNRTPLDPARAEAEWIEVALTAKRAHPDIGYWLFECANMPPYRAGVERATGVPVYDALTHGCALVAKAITK